MLNLSFPGKGDISTLQKKGHFHFALTVIQALNFLYVRTGDVFV